MTRNATLALGAGVALALLAAVAVRLAAGGDPVNDGRALLGEARQGGVTIALPDAVADVRIREARVPGRPIVLIAPALVVTVALALVLGVAAVAGLLVVRRRRPAGPARHAAGRRAKAAP